jgi:PAS domain S-box-containing protein
LKLPIRVTLLTGSFLLLVALSAILAFTFQRVVALSIEANTAIREVQETNKLASKISAVLLRQHNLCHGYYLLSSPDTGNRFAKLSFVLSENYLQLEKTSRNLRDMQKISELKSEHYRFENIAMRLFVAKDAGRDEEAAQALSEMDSRLDSLAAGLSALSDLSVVRSDEIVEELQTSLFNYAWVMGIIVVLTMLGAVGNVILIRQTVLKPTKRLIKGTEKVASGDLDFALSLKIRNELGDLARSFDAMLERLRGNRDEILHKTEALEALNKEIVALNENLEHMVDERTKALRESELYLERIIYGAPVSIAIFDKKGICRDCNEAFLRLTAAGDRDSVIGSAEIGNTPALSDRELVIAFGGALKGENRRTDSIGHEVGTRHRWYVHNLSPTIDSEGEVINVILFSEDVTEQKLARDALQAKNKELESFVYTVSHDLKSPLFSVSGLVRMLESELGSTKTAVQQQYMGRIISNLNNMEQMINDLLELSRLGVPVANFQKLKLNEVVRAAWLGEKVRYEEKNVEVQVANLPEIYADDRQISQLFSNIIGNAFKYKHPTRTLRIDVGYFNEPDFHHFVIEDNGVGIDPKISHMIFDVFFRGDSKNVDGTGVGLSIAKKIVENHGGRIWVESEPEDGSSFHFTLAKGPDRDII